MKKFIGSVLGNTLSILGVSLSEQNLENLEHIMSIVCMVFGLLITIVTAVIFPLIKWWKEAKKDGKISKDEIKDAVDIIKDGTESIKDIINKNEDKEEK